MWLSASDTLAYVVTLSVWLSQQNHPVPLKKLAGILEYWQQEGTVQLCVDEDCWLDLYSPRQVPTVDVYIKGVYEPHLSSEIKALLYEAYKQITPPG